MTAQEDHFIECSAPDQIAPRAYVRFVLGFRLRAPELAPEAARAIGNAVRATAARWPFLGCEVSTPGGQALKGRVRLRHAAACREHASEPLTRVRHHPRSAFAYSYDDLKQRSFPPALIDGDLLSDLPPLPEPPHHAPALQVQVNFIDGGILLAIYMHHSVGDGYCMKQLVHAIAEHTRIDAAAAAKPPDAGTWQRAFSFDKLRLNGDYTPDSHAAINAFPEFTELPEPYGPSQPLRKPYSPKSLPPLLGKIFVVPDDRLDRCHSFINHAIRYLFPNEGLFATRNDCLAAVLWAHLTRARRPLSLSIKDASESKLFYPVDYRKRLRRTPLPENYWGNAVAMTATALPGDVLYEASTSRLFWKIPGIESPSPADMSLARVAIAIHSTIQDVGDDYVYQRLDLTKSLPDMRRLGLNTCWEDNIDVNFNTWADLGADSEWSIPGVGDPIPADGASAGGGAAPSKPDVLRRAHHNNFANGGCLVMPRRSESDRSEILVQLFQPDMEKLLQDDIWMSLVDETVG